MNNEVKYWKSEYENLRRKKNKELELKQFQINKFMDKTLTLLKGLGLSDREILDYYGRKSWN